MATAFLTVTAALVAAITGAPALGRGKVWRGRRITLPKADSRGVRINTLRQSGAVLDIARQHVQWAGQVIVTVMARATPEQDGEDAADELLGQVWSRLAAATLPAGVVDLVLEPDITWDVDEADETVSTATFAITVRHVTQAATLVAP